MTRAEFESLVEKNYGYMRAVAWRKLRSWDDAEDAVQRALLNLWQRAERLDPSESRAAFSTLLVRATLAAAVDIIRERIGTKGDASGGRLAVEGTYARRHRIAPNEAISGGDTGDGRRVGRRRGNREPAAVSDGPSPVDLARLNEALALIPPEYVAVMWEIYGHGAKIADVARELGMSPAALRQKLHRFKEDVREVLDT